MRTDEDTIELLRRLAVHYSDDMISGILNRQGRKTATGERIHCWACWRAETLSRHSPFPGTDEAAQEELLSVRRAAEILELAPSTLLRWLEDGFLAGEQITPGAPWQIRMTEELKGTLCESYACRLSSDDRSNQEAGRIPANRVAESKAWRTGSRTCGWRKAQGLEKQSCRRSASVVRTQFMSRGAL